MNKKYWAFHRYDIEYWTVWNMTKNNFIFLFPIRFIGVWIIAGSYTTFMFIVLIGQPSD